MSPARKAWAVWGVLLIVAALVTIAAARFAYFPGDLALTLLVQSLTGESVGWAQAVTKSVSVPYIFALLALTSALAWRLAGWRAALLALVSFGGMWLAEPWLKSLAARPRPSPTLVRVVGSTSGFSFPSGFALFYFSTVGYLAMLAFRRLAGKRRWAWLAACGAVLLVGGAARVALGAHWPSDIYGAYLIGFVWTTLLTLLVLRGK
jgi:membrane-associated phospholipid phosphatase